MLYYYQAGVLVERVFGEETQVSGNVWEDALSAEMEARERALDDRLLSESIRLKPFISFWDRALGEERPRCTTDRLL